MSTNKTWTEQQKKDIEMIMRQTEHYDVKKIQEIYLQNKENVLDTVYQLLNLNHQTVPKKDDPFAEMRKILDEKDKIFEKVLAIKPKK